MLRKRTLLASSALAVLAGVVQAQAGDVYVSVLGGANLMQNHSGFQSNGVTTTFYKFDPDTGFFVGGAIGLRLDRWVKGLRTELEVSYRHNDVKGSWSSTSPGPSGSGAVDAHMSNFAVLANVWYDIDLGSKLVPYLGGGVGWDRADFEGRFASGGSHFKDVENGFAWQAGAGVNYQLQDGVSLGVGYRYFRGPDIRHDVFVGKNNLPGRLDNDNQSVMVNLTIDTN